MTELYAVRCGSPLKGGTPSVLSDLDTLYGAISARWMGVG